jgi:hypothetical protein
MGGIAVITTGFILAFCLGIGGIAFFRWRDGH